MKAPVRITPAQATPPSDSEAARLVPGSYFHDAWAIPAAEPTLGPLAQFLRVAQTTPGWIDGLMNFRNRVVGLFGLKNLGGLAQLDTTKPAADYRPGDRVGIFTLISQSATEALLGDSDKHLDVVVSVHKRISATHGAAEITVTTVVKVHNWLGRLYMVPVRPAHRVIARAMVRAIGEAV